MTKNKMNKSINTLFELINDTNTSEFLKVLSSVSCDLNVIDSFDHSLLHEVARIENSGLIINALIRKGMNVNLKNKAGRTPLFYSVNYSCHSNIRTLLQNNADVTIYDENLRTPLQTACSNNDLESAKILIEFGAVNFHAGDKETPLIKEVEAEAGEELIDFLLENGADINYGDGSSTALMAAVSYKNLKLVKHLLSKGAKVKDIKNLNGEDALEFAQRVGDLDIVKILSHI